MHNHTSALHMHIDNIHQHVVSMFEYLLFHTPLSLHMLMINVWYAFMFFSALCAEVVCFIDFDPVGSWLNAPLI